MRNFSTVLLGAALLGGHLFAATTIAFQVSNAGVDSSGAALFRYTYSFTDLTLQVRQEVDLRFDPAFYGKLVNGVAGPGFDLLLLQPNNPPGVSGDYSLYALVNNPALTGPFSVDFTYTGPGQPGPQPYFINQYDANGNFTATIGSGITTSPAGAIPEPATFGLMGLTSALAGGFLTVRRRFR